MVVGGLVVRRVSLEFLVRQAKRASQCLLTKLPVATRGCLQPYLLECWSHLWHSAISQPFCSNCKACLVEGGRAPTCCNQQQRWIPTCVPDAVGRGGLVDKGPTRASCGLQQSMRPSTSLLQTKGDGVSSGQTPDRAL